MGMITVKVEGSFRDPGERVFSAMHHGHADAVAQAIEYLSSEVLPKAIDQDHVLQEDGHSPEGGFGRAFPKK